MELRDNESKKKLLQTSIAHIPYGTYVSLVIVYLACEFIIPQILHCDKSCMYMSGLSEAPLCLVKGCSCLVVRLRQVVTSVNGG